MTEFRLTITHACCMRGHPVEPGTEVTLPPAEAQGLLGSGRARLVDPADEEALRVALAGEIQRNATALPVFGQTAEAAAVSLRELERAGMPRPIGFVWPKN